MTSSLDSNNLLNEKYFQVVELVKKLDPPNDPLCSKLAAKQILISMKSEIGNILDKLDPEEHEDHKRVTGMLSIVYIYLGIIDIETLEFEQAETQLNKSLQLIENFKENPDCASIIMNAYNQLGILWFQKDASKAEVYLDKSVETYNKHKNNFEPPKGIDDYFVANPKKDSYEYWEIFEAIHTSTLYYLAQVYGSLKDALKSAVYCHMTLKRQLVYKKYEAIDWALNAATLSQFFAEQKGFKQARHHLSASSYILDLYLKEVEQIKNEEIHKAKIEEYNHRSADVARCWAQYGLLILSKSRERLLEETEKDDPNYLPSSTDLTDLENKNPTVSQDDLSHLYFPSLDLTEYEENITDKFVLTLNEAKEVFLNSQKWIIKSQTYYTLEHLASDFIEITLSHTELYKELAFFDDNMENQAKYHKRRIDLLENLLDKVNSQYYLNYCRNMWYECGHSYIDLLNTKLDKLREIDQRPNPHLLTKVNNIVTKGLKHFQSFLSSFNKVSRIDEQFYSSYAKAQFYIGALNGKYITLDKKKKLEDAEASLDAYQKVIDFCEKYEGAKNTIAVEYGVCKEMAELLPVKIRKLKSDMTN